MIHWLHTGQHPSVHAGRRKDGWREHGIEHPSDNPNATELRFKRALCGLLPRHGWGYDLFVEERCERCERKAGLPPSAATLSRHRARDAVRLGRRTPTAGQRPSDQETARG